MVATKKPASKPMPKAKLRQAKRISKSKANFWVKDLLLALVNIGFVVAIFFLLSQLAVKASELKALRSAELQVTARGNIDIAELKIEAGQEKADRLFVLFPDESGLIDFVNEIDKLKAEGLVTRFSFASEQAVADKTGYLGIPLVIEFLGTWEQINTALTTIETLPYLIRPITIEVRPQEEENLIIFKYGGFLYVDESLANN